MNEPSGYLLLLLLAVLAPTPVLVPLDGIILGLIHLGYNPIKIIVLALVGDIIGTALIFWVGRKSRAMLAEYRKKRKRKDYVIAEDLFHRYHRHALILSGVPFLGDALIFLSGFYRLPVGRFIPWFLLGKILWYGLIILPGASLISISWPF